jgi:hypothetical protein
MPAATLLQACPGASFDACHTDAPILVVLPQRPLASGVAHWLAARLRHVVLPDLALVAVEALLRPTDSVPFVRTPKIG